MNILDNWINNIRIRRKIKKYNYRKRRNRKKRLRKIKRFRKRKKEFIGWIGKKIGYFKSKRKIS